jgi:hypothetical protein
MTHLGYKNRLWFVIYTLLVYIWRYLWDLINNILRSITLDFKFLYCTPDDRMIETFSVQIIIKHKLCRAEGVVVFV